MPESIRYDQFFANSGDALYTASLDGKITSWNPGATALLGYEAHEIIGQPLSRLVPERERAGLAMIWRNILRGQHVSAFEAQRIHKNGRPIDVSLQIFPMRDDNGEISGLGGVVRDDRERRKALTRAVMATATLDMVVESVPFGFLAVASNHAIIVVNDFFWQVWGLEPADWSDKSTHELRELCAYFTKDPGEFHKIVEQRIMERRVAFDLVELIDGRVLRRIYAPMHWKNRVFAAHLWIFEELT